MQRKEAPSGKGVAGTTVRPAAGEREQLKESVWERLAARDIGMLNSVELRIFAEFTGFSGTDAEWDEEFVILCQQNGCDPSRGLRKAVWLRLLDDSSQDGCHCSDEELREILAVLGPAARAPAAVAERGAPRRPEAGSRAPPAPPQAPPAPPQAEGPRDAARRRAFACLDADGDGRLCCAELRRLGEFTGFDGGDADWLEEYTLLSQEMGCDPVAGIGFEAFASLVDDQTSTGCYCSDAELEALAVPAPPTEAPQVAGRSGGALEMRGGEQPPPPSSTREDLKRQVFGLLDTDKRGRLSCAEFRRFADESGFDGSDDDWADEFAMLCDSLGVHAGAGISMDLFSNLVDDDSTEGVYMSDEELAACVEKFERSGISAGACPKDQPPGVVPATSSSGKGLGQAARKGAPADPWSDYKGHSDKGKGGGGKGGKSQHRAAVGDTRAASTAADSSSAGDPWASQADPWASQVDPWSTPGALSAERKRKQAAATASASSWGAWVDSGKPGAESDPRKPAMDAQKLLEASRAMIAARKAKEQEEAAQQERGAPGAPRHADGAASVEGGSPSCSSSSGAALQRAEPSCGPRIQSMPEALSRIGVAIANIALGDSNSIQDLVSVILRAPCKPHAIAKASHGVRLLLEGLVEQARNLLGVSELHVSPLEGDTMLLLSLSSLARGLGGQGAPFLLPALLAALKKIDDKQATASAARATEDIASFNDPYAFEPLLPILTAALDTKRSPAMKLQGLHLLGRCQSTRSGREAVAQRLPQLLPAVVPLLVDTNFDVRASAGDAVEQLLALVGNDDLEPHLKDIYGCYKGSKDLNAFVQALAQVVFAQPVDARALAAVMPVLTKGLKSRNTRTQRQTCIIAANMCKLVSAITDDQPFAPLLLPSLKRIKEEGSDPDLRGVAERAYNSLSKVAEDAIGDMRSELKAKLEVLAEQRPADAIDSPAPCPKPVRSVLINFVAMLSSALGQAHASEEEWSRRLEPYLEPLVASSRLPALVADLRRIVDRLAAASGASEAQLDAKAEVAEEKPDSLDVLCDCTITLACGAATLLSGARLRLARGHVYGLIGANDSGKSSLLRALHDRRVVGFPPEGCHVVTAFVEHGIGESPASFALTPLEYIMQDPGVKAMRLGRTAVATFLQKMDFVDGRLEMPVGMLSGGWRMKLGLVLAMIKEADVLLMDEPTGHLDAAHVAWLADYINDLKSDSRSPVTAVIVSHDTPFLDRVCTDIIHLRDARLIPFHGNLSQFLVQAPNTQLGSAPEAGGSPTAAFTMPEPGPLEGIKSRGRRFLYLEGVSFTYPGKDYPAVRKASVECSLRSRVAIVGPNGAGKSTLAGLVVGEKAPDRFTHHYGGIAWRHPNLRVAFVAQSTFHHLPRDTALTATEYILRRFEGNEDHEATDLRVTQAEYREPKAYRLDDAERLVPCCDGEMAVQPESVLGRRQCGRSGYEYEVQWCGSSSAMWVSGADLIAMGHRDLVRREDERQAAARSLSARPLTTPAVEMHLAGFGISAEVASHRLLRSLSDGQRARVVLAAATWLAPHLLVLDEPTNYLDRAGLAALTAGLQNFGGGVMVISHSTAFLDQVCTERWIMKQGMLQVEGAPAADSTAVAVEEGGAGPAPPGGLSAAAEAAKAAKEKKRRKRMKALRRKNGEEVSDDEEEWWEDLMEKANRTAKR